jgi:hypothetical protein
MGTCPYKHMLTGLCVVPLELLLNINFVGEMKTKISGHAFSTLLNFI